MNTKALNFKNNQPVAIYLSKKTAPVGARKINNVYVSECNIEMAMTRLEFLLHQSDMGKINAETQQNITSTLLAFIDPDNEDAFHLMLVPFDQWSEILLK